MEWLRAPYNQKVAGAFCVWGAQGRWPVVRGSLPRTLSAMLSDWSLLDAFGWQPNATGQRPVLPRDRHSHVSANSFIL